MSLSILGLDFPRLGRNVLTPKNLRATNRHGSQGQRRARPIEALGGQAVTFGGDVSKEAGVEAMLRTGAITKRMTAIEEMAGMDVLCSDKTGILTLNKLTVDKNLIKVFAKDVEKDAVVLMIARPSRLENQDVIDAAVVAMLTDAKELFCYLQTCSTCNRFLPPRWAMTQMVAKDLNKESRRDIVL